MVADATDPTRDAPTEASRAAARGVAWLGTERWATNVVSGVAFLALGRLLNPDQFGVVAAATTVVLFLRLFVDAGFQRALVQRERISDELIDTAFWTSMATSVGLALGLFACAPLVAEMFGEPQLTNVTRVLSVVFLFTALDSTQSALIDRTMQFRVQAIRRFSATATGAAVGVVLALAGAGVWALVAQTITVEVVLVVLLWSLASWRPRLRFSRAAFRELSHWGRNYLGIRTLVYLYENADNFLVGVVLGPVALGIYVIGYRVLVVFNEAIALTADQVTLPLFSRFQAERDRLHPIFYRTLNLGAAAALPAYAVLALTAHDSLPFVFGDRWIGSVPVMQSLALAGAIQAIGGYLRNLMLATGQVANEFRWNLLLTVATVAGFGATVHWGVTAVALSLGVVALLLLPLRITQVRRLCQLDLRSIYGSLAGPLVATAAMAVPVVAVTIAAGGLPRPVRLLLALATAAAAYPLALRVVAPVTWRSLLAAARTIRHR